MSFAIEDLLDSAQPTPSTPAEPEAAPAFTVEDLLDDAPEQPKPPLIQRAAQAFGVEPQPIPELEPPVFTPPERPPQVRTMEQITGDLREAAKFNAGLRVTPKGNLPAKAEALRQDAEGKATPQSEKSLLQLALDVPGNAIDELREIPRGIGLLLGSGLRDVAEFAGNVSARLGFGLKDMKIFVPNPETGQLEETTLPFGRVKEIPKDLREKLVRMGASFGPPSQEGSVFDLLLEAEAKRAGFPSPDELPEDATTFGVPLIDREFSPRVFAEQTSQFPISRLLDLALIGRLPSLAGRGGAAASRAGAVAAAKAEVPRIERQLAHLGVRLDEFADAADAVASVQTVRNLARKGAKLSPVGREFLVNHDARKLTRELIRENSELSFARRRNAEVEIGRALRDLSDDELRLLPTVLEGRAEVLSGQMTPQLGHALDVTKRNIWVSQKELIDLGLLKSTTVENRAFAPLVIVKTGKRIPSRDWDAARVFRENEKIINFNQQLTKGGGSFVDASGERTLPLYMRPDELELELSTMKSQWKAVRQNMNGLPETAELAPTYFPRFAAEPTVRDVMAEFFPSLITGPGRQPFQRQFSGASLLRNADIADVNRSLLEHNARVRRLVDGTKAIDELKAASFTKTLKIDARGKPTDLLPGHVAFNPDGSLQFFRRQLDMGEETARALENMGDFESSLAEGVRSALGGDLNVTFMAAARRQNIFQIPRGAAKELEATFRPTSPMTRVLWDRPTDAWKAGVLAFSPRWHVNNIVGGMVLGTMAGVPPARLLKPLSAIERSAIPERMSAQTFVFSEGFRPRLPAPPTTASGRVARAVTNTAPLRLPMQALRTVRDKSFGFNSAVDQHFRSRVYLEQAKKVARTQLVKETGKGIIESRDILTRAAELAKDPVAVRDLIRRTDRVFFNFNKITPNERRYIRRVLPFWAWYREIARVTLSMPETMPGRAQALRSLSKLGLQADDSEVRKHLGIPKRHLPEYLRGQVFTGLDNEGNVSFMSPRGANVFYGATMLPLSETQGRLHPALRFLIEESTGGRTVGKWGTYLPFKFQEAGKKFALDKETGALVEKGGGRAAGKRLARTIPITGLLEDLTQFATEGRISQRFDDVTPFSNIVPAATGGRVVPTSVPDRSRDFAPRREKSIGQVLGSFFGVSTSRYRLQEILENEVKMRSQDLETIFTRKYVSDPEFRSLFDEVLAQMAGEPFEGLRTLDTETGREATKTPTNRTSIP